jgi:thymidylate synthase
MNNLDKEYQMLLEYILGNGIEKKDRTGTGTLSVFGWQIRHKMSEGFPLLTTKKMAWKSIVAELLWFLRGDTNIKFLLDYNCHIWDGDAYKRYADSHNTFIDGFVHVTPMAHSKESFIEAIKTDNEFAKKWGDLGPIYGKQWRSWETFTYDDYANRPKWIEDDPVDQIENLINDLKTNPDSRRLMVNAWNVGELDQMVLPPCHYGFQVYTRELSLEERATIWNNTHNPAGNIYTHNQYDENEIPARAISLMFNMRSNDVPLGLPFNIASYALLLEIIGKMVNMVPGELITNLGDAHIYKNQIDGVKEQLTRTPMKLPDLIFSDEVNFNGTIDGFLESCDKNSFKLDGYESHPPIKIPLSN